jgi:hypothetical protein
MIWAIIVTIFICSLWSTIFNEIGYRTDNEDFYFYGAGIVMWLITLVDLIWILLNWLIKIIKKKLTK